MGLLLGGLEPKRPLPFPVVVEDWGPYGKLAFLGVILLLGALRPKRPPAGVEVWGTYTKWEVLGGGLLLGGLGPRRLSSVLGGGVVRTSWVDVLLLAGVLMTVQDEEPLSGVDDGSLASSLEMPSVDVPSGRLFVDDD